jgi:hypothetical protein
MVELELVDDANAELAIPSTAPIADVPAELPVISDAQVAKVEDLGESTTAAAASSADPAHAARAHAQLQRSSGESSGPES